ncbi:MAG: hypothetical protein ACD_11C00028G0019 [uncultured bacterium]|nr:MAG: hypothetical protein ACD_11C00028G0019 [uncultured bacterium]HBR71616.1 30S ribosomal protein S16 [Candidatus Moranbacteria bacterium]
MLTIRFARVGRRNKAQFRIVLQDRTAAPTGKHIAVLGSYDPHSKVAVLKKDKIQEWIGKGAQASVSVHNIFVREGVITEKKKAVKMEKPKKKEEAPVEEVKIEEEKKAE